MVRAFFLFVFVAQLLKSNASYLYMSTHDYPNIYVFDASSGDMVTKSLLNISALNINKDNLHFRGLNIYNNQLYIANSAENYSFIAYWTCVNNGNTLAQSNLKSLQFGNFFSNYNENMNPGLVHPYDIYWSSNNTLLASAQDTDSALIYNSFGKPMSIANEIYPGAFATYGPFQTNSNGIRGICSDNNGLVYVAMETLNSILVYNMNDNYKNIYNITWSKDANPIAVREGSPYYPGYLFVGDSSDDSIVAFKVTQNEYKKLWTSEKTSHLNHPAGLSVTQDALYVVSQNTNNIVEFDPLTGDYLKKVVDFSKENVSGENLLYIEDAC